VAFRAVIWDLDGTLSDTEELHFRAWQNTMASHDLDYPYEVFIAGFGRSNLEMLAEQMPTFTPHRIVEISEQKEHAYRQLLQPGAIELLAGVQHWLDLFRALGIDQVLGSSAPMANIVTMIDVLGIGGYFHGLLSGYRVPRGKPDPMLFVRCAAAIDVAPQECLVIEDSIHGVEAAYRAAMHSIAVGKIARTDAVQAYVASPQPRTLAVDTLEALTSEQILALFANDFGTGG
jgi:beta-phosphoglucomutase